MIQGDLPFRLSGFPGYKIRDNSDNGYYLLSTCNMPDTDLTFSKKNLIPVELTHNIMLV